MMGKAHPEKGFISLLILMVLVFLSWKGFQAFYKTASYERMVRYETQRIKAACWADSGLEWAEAAIEQNPAWPGGTRQYAGGEIVIQVKKTGQVYTITSSSKIDKTVQKKYGNYLLTEESLVLIRSGELYE